ncbi:three component ABC system middle component [Actinomadura sediminis]|uniref:Three component ABC system middle component n=1 Tax=Actinomadura sediminis TaxID=1038904 RepID=A0ABW3F180_9ACTN
MNAAGGENEGDGPGRGMRPTWGRQPLIAAAMLNPALISAVLATAADGHQKEAEQGMPWSLSFIVAPLVLHRGTRQALPGTKSTHLTTWLTRNAALRVGFPHRARALVDPVRQGLQFGLTHGVVMLEADRLNGRVRRPRGFRPPDELDEILRKASFVGRWLARTGSTATVFAVFGVAP